MSPPVVYLYFYSQWSIGRERYGRGKGGGDVGGWRDSVLHSEGSCLAEYRGGLDREERRKNEVGGWGGAGCMREGNGKRGGMRV